MHRGSVRWMVLVPLCLSLPLVGPRPGSGAPLATVHHGEVSLEWSPQVEHAGLVLTISGPDGFYLREEFSGGSPSFSVFDKAGQLLPDGYYTWELVATPRIDPAEHQQLLAARAAGKPVTLSGGVDHGSFAIHAGRFLAPTEEAPRLAPRTPPSLATRDFVIADDLIVQGSACIGLDCVNNENFGFDTIRLKENNLRIKFEDTSTTVGFPTRDWQLTANDSGSGGLDKFSIEDITAARVPFTVEGNADANSLYVDTGRRIGIGTNAPVLNLHIKTGNTPALRLEQDNSSGFTPQVWDVAGNEANFFVRDVTGGSTLPLRIQPGAPSSSLFVAADGDVGLGTAAPTSDFHVIATTDPAIHFSSASQNALRVQSTAATNTAFLFIENAGLAGDFNNVGIGSSNNNLVLRAGDSTKMLVGGGGNVVIGLTTEQDHDFEIHAGGAFSEIDAGEAQFTTSSSRTLKSNVTPVQAPDILEKVAGVGVYTYDFIDGPEGKIGLMAEDFHQIFGRGSDKLLNGHEVQMALWLAVQELAARSDEIASLRQELEALKQRLQEP